MGVGRQCRTERIVVVMLLQAWMVLLGLLCRTLTAMRGCYLPFQAIWAVSRSDDWTCPGQRVAWHGIAWHGIASKQTSFVITLVDVVRYVGYPDRI